MTVQWLKNLSHKAAHVKMLNPVYNASLGKPDELLEFSSFPPDLFVGDVRQGRWVASGYLDLCGYRLPLDQKNWLIGKTEQSTPFFDCLHGFDFLLDLKALGGEISRKAARTLTENWLNDFQNYHHIVWEVDLTSHRLVNWLIAYPFAFETADDDFLLQLHHSMHRQYYHLERILESQRSIHPFDLFSLLWALIICQCHCQDFYDEISFPTYMQLIKGVMDELSLPDGGLSDHNPQNMLEMLKSLVQLRQSLQQNEHTVPTWLSLRIDRLSAIVHSLTHSDGDLPQFQRCILPNKNTVAMVLKHCPKKVRRTDIHCPDTGYTSIRKGRTSLMIDHVSRGCHTAPFAFEMAHHGYRMITSCGTHMADEQWKKGLSNIAAHSTLMVDEHSPKNPIAGMTTSLDNLNGAALFCGTHEGYNQLFGLTHIRRLYLDQDGEDLRGEDLLTRKTAIKSLPIILRFHLHPMVKASLIDKGKAVLIRLGKGSGWIYRANCGHLSLENSVYCPDGLTIRKSMQIVLSVPMTDLDMQVKWAFKRQN